MQGKINARDLKTYLCRCAGLKQKQVWVNCKKFLGCCYDLVIQINDDVYLEYRPTVCLLLRTDYKELGISVSPHDNSLTVTVCRKSDPGLFPDTTGLIIGCKEPIDASLKTSV